MTGRPRGKRGAGSAKRRHINRAAEERQRTWLGKAPDGRVEVSSKPTRVRVAELTAELDDLFTAKRETVKGRQVN